MEQIAAVKRHSRKQMDTKTVVKIGMLSAISIVLMLFELTLPIFPSFLKLDISDLPALVGAVTMGPLAGMLIELVKNLLHLFQTSTAGVGELANFLVGIALVLPLGFCYQRKKSLAGYLQGLVLGAACMVVVACVFNYYILIPAFSVAFGTPVAFFVEMGMAIKPHVGDLKTLVVLAVGPFNLIKAALIGAIGYPLCKAAKKILSLH